MKKYSYILAYIGLLCNQANASENIALSDNANLNQELLKQIKSTIKPVDLSSLSPEESTIRYELPKTTLNATLGDTTIASNLNLVVSEKKGYTEDLAKLKSDAYQAALMGQTEASLYLYKQALSYEPNNVNLIFAIGSLYHNLHQIDDAKAMYKKTLKLEPEHSKAINNYISLMAEFTPREALQELRVLEGENADYAPVLAQMGMIYAKLNLYAEAEIYLRKAISSSPETMNYRYNLAVLYDKVGACEPAIKLYQQIVYGYGTFSNAPYNIEKLNRRIEFLKSKMNHDTFQVNANEDSF